MPAPPSTLPSGQGLLRSSAVGPVVTMGIIKLVSSILALAVLVIVGIAGYAYVTDYAVEAEVTEKGSDAEGRYIILTPQLYPYPYKQYLDQSSWSAVCEGNYVLFNVRSQHYALYTKEGGELVYDSDRGLVNTGAAMSCAIVG